MRVKFISPKKGFGIFSEERILKGEFIIEYAGEVISNSDVSERIRPGFQKWPIFLTTIGYRLHDFEIFRLQLRYKLHDVATL